MEKEKNKSIDEGTNVIPKKIGRYEIIRQIGKGGMGEIFLAYDPICKREIALKRIRSDLSKKYKSLNPRFLKEVNITCQLSHPSIVPIYTLNKTDNSIYYTMPFIEGETLKEILQRTRIDENKSNETHPIGGSIPSLIRIFLQICNAVAYAHNNKVLHRDLKPDNIMVGKYGEVLILDWGIAKTFGESLLEEEQKSKTIDSKKAKNKKAVGTLSYLSPERILGAPADHLTDLYALGVILYQILTLHIPFTRKTAEEYPEIMEQETFFDPAELAPYRDVPEILSHICEKALSPTPEDRQQSVNELTNEIENYLEGHSEWFFFSDLDIKDKSQWRFQENIFLADHVALTGSIEAAEWVNLMVSKLTFPENIQVTLKIRIKEESHGFGLLVGIPTSEDNVNISDGYYLWLGSEKNPSSALMRSDVKVLRLPQVHLSANCWHKIHLTKTGDNISFTINNSERFSYVSHLPVRGTHLGILTRDAHYDIQNFKTYIGNLNISVSCLAVPNAFLAHTQYDIALNEYRRIARSFPGHAESREARFRAGVTLIEKAKNNSEDAEKEAIFNQAWKEFEKLHTSPGAPLEYLGKSLVHRALKENEEEVKCLELAYRKFPKHPLLPILQDQIVYRLHDTSRHHRLAAYRFSLLTVRFLSNLLEQHDNRKLFTNLYRHWETPHFFEKINDPFSNKLAPIAIQLAFFLNKPYCISEVLDELQTLKIPPKKIVHNALYSLLNLGCTDLVKEHIDKFKAFSHLENLLHGLESCLHAHENNLIKALDFFGPHNPNKDPHALTYLLEYARKTQKLKLIIGIKKQLTHYTLSPSQELIIHSQIIWGLLLLKDYHQAKTFFDLYPLELLNNSVSILHFLYACYLEAKEGHGITSAHLSEITDSPFPRSWSLAPHYLFGRIAESEKWFDRAFDWEKHQLYQQLHLYYSCAKDLNKAKYYLELANKLL